MRVETLTALEMAPAGRATKQNPRTAVAIHPAREKKRLILVTVEPQERLSRAEKATILQGEKRAGIRPVGCFVVHRVFGGRP